MLSCLLRVEFDRFPSAIVHLFILGEIFKRWLTNLQVNGIFIWVIIIIIIIIIIISSSSISSIIIIIIIQNYYVLLISK